MPVKNSDRNDKQIALKKTINRYLRVSTAARSSKEASHFSAGITAVTFPDSKHVVIYAEEPETKGNGVRIEITIDYALIAPFANILTASSAPKDEDEDDDAF